MTSAAQSADSAKLNFADPQVMECPYPLYKKLRNEAPAYFVEEAGFWIISRYDDCLAAVKNPKVFSSKMGFRPGAVPEEVTRIFNEEGFGALPIRWSATIPPRTPAIASWSTAPLPLAVCVKWKITWSRSSAS
jgi:cytochrome P450